MNTTPIETLPDRLRSSRKFLKMSQQAVADHLGVHVSTINKYELGQRNPDIPTLVKLADLLGVSLDFLVSGNVPTDFIEGQLFMNPETSEFEQANMIEEAVLWKESYQKAMAHMSELLKTLNSVELKTLVSTHDESTLCLLKAITDDFIMELVQERFLDYKTAEEIAERYLK